MLITETDGYEFVEQDHDKEESRFVIAFFKKNPDAKPGDIERKFPIMETGEGVEQTVSAIAVTGNTVIASDRKRIRSGGDVA